MDLAQRYRGCLLVLAVGDAVGTALEFKPPGSFNPITDMTGGGPLGLKPGQWTDDTSMALCLAERPDAALHKIVEGRPPQLHRRVLRHWQCHTGGAVPIWADGSTSERFDGSEQRRQRLNHAAGSRADVFRC
jgi:ADP-ribosylglycohydrolase